MESTSILDVRIVRECFHRLIMNYLIIGTLFNGAEDEEHGGRRRLAYHHHCVMCVHVSLCSSTAS